MRKRINYPSHRLQAIGQYRSTHFLLLLDFEVHRLLSDFGEHLTLVDH